MPTFWRVFIINWCWMLSKDFSASIEMIIWFFSFSLLIWCITLVDLHILKNPWIPGINPTWSWCMILLMCCWILFASILLRIFASMIDWLKLWMQNPLHVHTHATNISITLYYLWTLYVCYIKMHLFWVTNKELVLLLHIWFSFLNIKKKCS